MKRLKQVLRRYRYLVIFLICSIVPVICIVCMLLFVIQKNECKKHQMELQYVAERVWGELKACINLGVSLSDTVYVDERVYQYVDKEYQEPVEYYKEFYEFNQNMGLNYVTALYPIHEVAIYTMNPTILSGSFYFSLSDELELPYKFRWLEGNGSKQLYFEYHQVPGLKELSPQIELVRKLDYYETKYPIYMCMKYNMSSIGKCIDFEKNVDEIFLVWNSQIFSAKDKTIVGKVFDESMLDKKSRASYRLQENVLGSKLDIIVQDEKVRVGDAMKDSNLEVMLVLISMMSFFGYIIHSTFIREEESHELMLSKVKAEMNALNSQVNPHFLYNTLESICMRSVLKGEIETSGIIRNLASLMHKMSTWGEDDIPVREEIQGVSEYLLIQKYRFGDKLEYEVEIEDACYAVRVPKLSIMSLVENACIHGIGHSLEAGVIRVRLYEEGEEVVISVEDTGAGMPSTKLSCLQKRIENAKIEDIETNEETGLLNAYLRLKGYFKNQIQFEISSILDQGTTVQIRIQVREG